MAQEGTKETRISLIAAIGAQTRALGKNNELLWHLPEDMKRFKALTAGHPVIMGRKTWESIPEKYRPLPDRFNIVVTRDSSYEAPGAQIVSSFPEALSYAKEAPGAQEIFVIGGGEIYRCALPFASRLYLTLVDDPQEGDVSFPTYEDFFTKTVFEESRNDNGIHFTWRDLERE